MRRLHLAKDDLDWLPERYRLLRGIVVGSVWASVGGGVAAAMLFGAHFFIFTKLFVAIGTGGYWLGDRVSKSVVSSRLAKLASGQVDLSRLSNNDDGDLVHVRGIVRADRTVPARLGGPSGVYRRLRARFGDVTAIEEEAVDFQLVDAEGNAIVVETDGARWLVHDGKLKKTSADLLPGFEEMSQIAKWLERSRTWLERKKRVRSVEVHAAQAMLCVGDEVEVVGYKSRKVDPTVVDRLARETPMRATLRGGKELPVMISRVRTAA